MMSLQDRKKKAKRAQRRRETTIDPLLLDPSLDDPF